MRRLLVLLCLLTLPALLFSCGGEIEASFNRDSIDLGAAAGPKGRRTRWR